MRLIWDILLFVVIAAGLGLSSAYMAINHAQKIDLYQIGPWMAWPEATSPKSDPYTQALQAREGELLLGAGEGLSFEANHDDDGTPLDGACQYRVSGEQLPARLWTLSLVDETGHFIDNPSSRYGFHSQALLRHSGDAFDIQIGPQALSGNWLQSPSQGKFRLLLRLYDTPLTSGGTLADITLPSIRWESCR
ncbi:MAG: DUF1214 domain-containing protein [Cohaesibacter sp.]|nr:DUF1214 domain-containing protein [Cohaesibacter sp.]